MNIPIRTVRTIAAWILLLFCAICVTSWFVVVGRFSELEQNFCVRNIGRSQAIVMDRRKTISEKLADWASWDDTYKFMEDKNAAYINSNLVAASLQHLRIDFIIYVNQNKEIFYTYGLDPAQGVEKPVPESLKNFITKESALLTDFSEDGNAITGLIMLPEGPLLLASKPILTSEGKGPAHGSLIFTDLLSGSDLDDMGKVIYQKLDAHPIYSADLPADFKEAKATLLKGKEIFLKKLNAKEIAGYSVLKDVLGNPVLILRVTMAREIFDYGKQTFYFFALAIIIFSSIFGAAIFLSLESEIRRRKESEDRLTKAQEELLKLGRAIEQSPGTVVITNTKGEIEYANPKFVELTGYTLKEAMGKNPRILKSGEVASEVYKQLWETISSGNEWHGEFRNKKKNGDLYWENASISPVRNSKGEITHYVAVKEDITERKEAETRMKKKIDETVSQLLQAAKLTALGELTAGVAHELNQPLNVTKIICQGILRDIQKGRFSLEEAQTDLPEILNQTNRMAEIINHMRVFSRKTEGTIREEHDISVLISNALKFISQQLKDHNIALVTNLASGLPHVIVDPVRIEQVCLNLLNNARYAVENSGKKEMKIEIKAYLGADGKEVVIEISDNGIGIPDSVKDKIFQPFFTTKDPGKGTGLGLSVSHEILEEHKGRIEFTSREGEGTAFQVFLPGQQ